MDTSLTTASPSSRRAQAGEIFGVQAADEPSDMNLYVFRRSTWAVVTSAANSQICQERLREVPRAYRVWLVLREAGRFRAGVCTFAAISCSRPLVTANTHYPTAQQLPPDVSGAHLSNATCIGNSWVGRFRILSRFVPFPCRPRLFTYPFDRCTCQTRSREV